MASVEKLPSGRYRGVYYLAGRPGEPSRKRRVKGTFAHKRAARDAAIEAEGRSIADPQHDPAHGRMTWARWERAWTPTRVLSPKQTVRAETLVRLHVEPRWGSTELVEITHHDVQVWVNGLVEAGQAASSARAAFFTLSASLKSALRAGHVRANPCTGVILPRPPAAPERFLTDGEVALLVYRFDGRYRVLVEILLEAGLRFGEAAGLHWQRVDLEARTIRVAEQWDDEAGERGEIRATKGKAARTVPLTDDLAGRLTAWAKECPPRASCGLAHAEGRCRSSLVVPSRSGLALDGSNFHARQWKKAIRLAGIGHCRPHDLRHTWASRLVTAGVPLALLQVWGGWEDYSTVQRYAHLMSEDHDLYREALKRRKPPGAVLRVVE